MKYQVDMQRVITEQVMVEIEADSEEEAREKAIANREDYDWSGTDADYNSIEIQKVD